MNFNPLKYALQATYLEDQGEWVTLQVKWGSKEESFKFPKSLLPPEVKLHEEFLLRIQPKESIHQDELQTLKKLLQELIN